ncbi:MAG: FHA domain-containing protein [Planctomycetes bacterium]|nr:FHA domain-containing protein [Planctomycetota bacterium]
MPFLESRGGSRSVRVELTGDPITVGRSSENALVVDADGVSRRHCVVERTEGGWQVRDLASRNGVRVNGTRTDRSDLRNGDRIQVGLAELRFIDPAGAVAHPGPRTPSVQDDLPTASLPLERETPRKTKGPAAKVALPGMGPGSASRDERRTLDVDLNEVAAGKLEDAEDRLERICRESPLRSFEARDISLVDMRGQVIHQAASLGGERPEEARESVRLFRLLILTALRTRASDVHVEPRVDKGAIRLRVDGLMVLAAEISLDLFRRVLGMIKILCQIDTSQKAQVQDGHFSAMIQGRRVDFRVSLTPAMHGQKLVIRVLDTSNAPTRLHELGVLPWMYEKLRTVAARDSGMVLACGPTGSGKTTTLYACLREIDVNTRNAITIEDPVEYHLDGCTQIPIDHKQGNTFANILRSVLRQDPDVIFVGEIRDIETAQVAMQAAMTGHLVYSTVHSKDTIGAIFRLLDLGVESYLVANALNLIVAQRLCRSLCERCRRAERPTSAQLMRMGKAGEGMGVVHVPAGCPACLQTGYFGRRALLELLEFTEPLRDVVLKRPTIGDIRAVLAQGHFVTLQQFGYQLVAEGCTSLDEVDRVAGGE